MNRIALSAAAVTLLLARASNADVPIDDFENVSDWKGLDADATHVKGGSSAGRWDDHPNQTSASKKFASPLDVSKERALQFWAWSAVANGAEVMLVLDSDNPGDPAGWDYYSRSVVVDWTGWRFFSIPLEAFNVSRSPLGWNHINSIAFNATGWQLTPAADTVLVFDDMTFGSGVISSVTVGQQWQGADFVYTWDIGLEERTGKARNLAVSVDTGAGYSFLATVATPQVSLPALGNGAAQVSVKVPASEITPANRLRLERAQLLVSEQGTVRDLAELQAAVPLDPRSHPRTLMTQADVDRIATWAGSEAWAKSSRDSILAAAQKWPASFLQKYGVSQWSIPAQSGQWGHYYVCPKHGVGLIYTPPMTHTCPVDKETLSGWPYDQVIYGRMHNDLAAAARDLALAARLGGDAALAQTAAQILVGYADKYGSWAIHDIHDKEAASGGRVLAQTLDESVWLIPVAFAYDLLADTPALTDAQRQHVERDLLREAIRVIQRHRAGKSNWQSWHNAGIAAAAFAMDDPVGIASAWADPSNGFLFQMKSSVSSDGFWYEGSWGYHFYALDALVYLSEMAARAGLDPYGQPSMRCMFEAPLRFSMPNGQLPAFNDSGTADLFKQLRAYEVAYNRYQDPALAAFLSSAGRGRDALIFGAKSLPDAAQTQLPSLLFPEAGYAVLRAVSGDDASYLALDFGPHGGGHGHYDKLGYVLFSRGGLLGLDPGSQPYAAPTHATWDKMTVAHNTVVVDETSQAEGTGQLHRFASLPAASFAAADDGDACATATLLRSMLLTPEYAVDRVRAQASDAAPHALDWIHHAAGELTSSAPLQPWTGFPSGQGYQHLEQSQGAALAGDWQVSFDQRPSAGPYGSTYADKAGIAASFSYSKDQAVSGAWSGKMSYDFSQAAGYVLFNTPDLVEIPEVPSTVRFELYGDMSGNELSIRLYDSTDERFVKAFGKIDWSGWRTLEASDLSGWAHYLGNADGVFDPPAKRVAIEVKSAAGGLATGTLHVDDIRLVYAGAGEVTVADFELAARGLRLWMKGEPGTTLVTGEGLGPNLLEPVPFAMARRNASDSTFLTLLETYGDAPSVSSFGPLTTSAASAEEPLAVEVVAPKYRDRILALANPSGASKRTFGEASCDGVVCLIRSDDSGAIRRVAAAEATVVHDGKADQTIAKSPLPGLQVDWDDSGQRVDVAAQTAIETELRILGPAIQKVFVGGTDTPFTRDGDYVVLNLQVVPDAGAESGVGGAAGADAGAEGGGDAGSGAEAGAGAASGEGDDGCGCTAVGRAGWGAKALLVAAVAWVARRRRRQSVAAPRPSPPIA